MALETALAKASMTNVQRRDPNATYHLMPADSLQLLTPNFVWKDYFDARLKHPDVVNVMQPDFFRAFDQLITSTPVDTWRDYLRWAALSDAAPTLEQGVRRRIVPAGEADVGAKEQQPRWKRCLAAEDRDLGDMLGKAYVAQAFPPQARERALQLVHNLEAALDDKIGKLEWMSEETRKAAAGKLAAFDEKIGYPDKWRDYSKVEITRGPVFANRLSARVAESARNMDRIGKPVERGEWRMTPPTVNAFYQAVAQQHQLPGRHPAAAVLRPLGRRPGELRRDRRGDRPRDDARLRRPRPPVRRPGQPARLVDARRRGGLQEAGAARGRAVRRLHRERHAARERQAHAGREHRRPGRAGGGVRRRCRRRSQASRAPNIGGFTPEQRFFLGYARVWSAMDRPEGLRTRVLTDSHSPAHWRVNGPLSNLQEFHDAWGCKDGDGMVRPADLRARIW
jgi:predicted metalloendopeptidase